MAKAGYRSKSFAWSIESHFRDAAKYMEGELQEAIAVAVAAGEAKAAQRIETHYATDPEHLRGSLVMKVGNLWGGFGTDVWYARFVEYGTVRMGAIPFIKPGNTEMRKVFMAAVGHDLARGFKTTKVRTRATSKSGLNRAFREGRIGKREYGRLLREHGHK